MSDPQTTKDYFTIVPADFTPINRRTGLNRIARLNADIQEAYQNAIVAAAAQVNPPAPYGWIYFDPSFYGLYRKP